MHLTRLAFLALLSIAAPAHAADGIRYLELVNRAHASIIAVAVAPAGSGRFQHKQIDALAGGGGATTLSVADAGCRYDLQVGFRTGQSVTYQNVDVCRGGRLVISAMRKDARYALKGAQPAMQVADGGLTPR